MFQDLLLKIINLKNIIIVLFGEKYDRECDTYALRSVNHEMYLQRVKKSTLSLFDDKRCYINETESRPWN